MSERSEIGLKRPFLSQASKTDIIKLKYHPRRGRARGWDGS